LLDRRITDAKGVPPVKATVALHRWLGIVLAALVVLAGATGSLLAFHHEIDAMLAPQLHSATPSSSRASLDSIAASIERQEPGMVVGYFVFSPNTPAASVRVVMNTRTAAAAGRLDREGASHREYYADPYSGAILGTRNWGEAGFAPASLIPMVYRLHMSLFAGEAGQWITGMVAALLIVSVVLGMALVTLRPSIRRGALRVKWSAGRARAFFDLHRSVGLIAAVPLLVIAFTGLYMNLPSVVEPVVRAVSPFTERPTSVRTPAMTRAEVWALGWDEAVSRARAAEPAKALAVAGRVEGRGYYQVRFMSEGDIVDAGSTRVFIHGRTGAVLGRFEDRKGSAGDVVRIWQFPLHSGQAFGLAGRLLVMTLGIAPVLLAATGVWLWVRRRRMRRVGQESLQGGHLS
jgi:uncharacterized iron-regulated membrane protein